MKPTMKDTNGNHKRSKAEKLFLGTATATLAVALGFATLGAIETPAAAGMLASSCSNCDGSSNSGCTDSKCTSCNWYIPNGGINDGYYKCQA